MLKQDGGSPSPRIEFVEGHSCSPDHIVMDESPDKKRKKKGDRTKHTSDRSMGARMSKISEEKENSSASHYSGSTLMLGSRFNQAMIDTDRQLSSQKESSATTNSDGDFSTV